jgi:pantetheine-phosphate adenylyltransferase
MITKLFPSHDHISVVTFDGLLVDFARKSRISLVIRGLRVASDFEYEFQLAAMNKKMNPDFETIFFMTGSETYFLSSRLIKEIAFLGGDVKKMVPEHVAEALNKKRTTF